jgi:D-sedoheptulose 7-phosphate isomerase
LSNFIESYLGEVIRIAGQIDPEPIEKALKILLDLREKGGRLFILGVGGSAANASHAVNDFRKICGIEAYSICDNVAELTARTNDAGWDSVFAPWLNESHLNSKDALLILSVGGGDAEKRISVNLIHAIDLAKKIGSRVIGIVGREGYTSKMTDACVIVPSVNSKHITVHSESFQSIIWHLLVAHPLLQKNAMKWESYEKN